jgi:DmsE family decaheme c-type cytochrome
MPGSSRRNACAVFDWTLPVGLVLTGAVALWMAGLPALAQSNQSSQGAPPGAPASSAPAPKPAPKTYVGSDTCQMCHEDTFNAFQRNPHHVLSVEKGRGWAGKACEACHGPGSAHADSANAADIIDPAKVPAAETNRICLKCHLNQQTQVGRIMSGHGRNDVPCTSCHSIHAAHGMDTVEGRTGAINKLCSKCHLSEWASFNKPFHHRLPEGAMSCVDCHNPHGSILDNSLQTVDANEPGCFKCHGNLRGPFVYDHAPVELGGCTECHEPHGSANPRMLIRQEVRFVCLECHANIGVQSVIRTGTLGGVPPAFHDLSSPRFHNCTTCHIKIHGSNVDRYFER